MDWACVFIPLSERLRSVGSGRGRGRGGGAWRLNRWLLARLPWACARSRPEPPSTDETSPEATVAPTPPPAGQVTRSGREPRQQDKMGLGADMPDWEDTTWNDSLVREGWRNSRGASNLAFNEKVSRYGGTGILMESISLR